MLHNNDKAVPKWHRNYNCLILITSCAQWAKVNEFEFAA